MEKNSWIRKLTSRKLWVSLAGFVTLLIIALGGTENQAAQVSALIMAGATVVGYVIGEGLADSKPTEKIIVPPTETPATGVRLNELAKALQEQLHLEGELYRQKKSYENTED